jgi:hypothetical protein
MILAIFAVWTVVIPCVTVGAGALVHRRARAHRPHVQDRWVTLRVAQGTPMGSPRCVVRSVRPGRAATRRVCPERAPRVRRRPASA